MNEDERPGMGALLKQMKERLEAWRYQWAVCPACSQSPHTRECVLLATINDIEHAQHQHLACRRDEPVGERDLRGNVDHALEILAVEDRYDRAELVDAVMAALTDRRAAGGTDEWNAAIEAAAGLADEEICTCIDPFPAKDRHESSCPQALAAAIRALQRPTSGAGERGAP